MLTLLPAALMFATFGCFGGLPIVSAPFHPAKFGAPLDILPVFVLR